MGLSNKYVGETRFAGDQPEIFSADWCHRQANKMTLALADEEAESLSGDLRRAAGEEIKNISPEKAHSLFLAEFENESIGRELEADEVEFLSQEPDYIVVDI